jgi:signal transduction histidine kinase
VIDAIRDEEGNLIGFAKITRDITERREAEAKLRHAQEQLAQSQKMEALGQLTGGIAHDFNNMIMVVSGNAQLLKQRVADARSLRAVEAIEGAAPGREVDPAASRLFSAPTIQPDSDQFAQAPHRLPGSSGQLRPR